METIGAIVQGRETVVVHPQTTVLEAARLMGERNIGAVPVLEADRVVGIFSERDVMTRVVAAARDPATTTVAEVMSTGLVVAQAGDSIESCLVRLQRAKVRHLLVLREGRFVGIISMRDIVAQELVEREQTIELLNAYIHYIPVDMSSRPAV
jgi:CBS domain-containing protein